MLVTEIKYEVYWIVFRKSICKSYNHFKIYKLWNSL